MVTVWELLPTRLDQNQKWNLPQTDFKAPSFSSSGKEIKAGRVALRYRREHIYHCTSAIEIWKQELITESRLNFPSLQILSISKGV